MDPEHGRRVEEAAIVSNYKTVHRRFQAWAQEILRSILIDPANALREQDVVDTFEHRVETAFANGRSGGLGIDSTIRGR